MTLTRALVALAVANMVVALALATLYPPLLPLEQLVSIFDGEWLLGLHGFVLQHLPGWVWMNVLLPLLLRPCWMVPACLSILFAGGATSLASRNSEPRSRHRRS